MLYYFVNREYQENWIFSKIHWGALIINRKFHWTVVHTCIDTTLKLERYAHFTRISNSTMKN